MGRIRGWVKRIEHAARGNLPSFELLDGSRYYYDPDELFMFWYACLGAGNPDEWPEPPEVCRRLTQAKAPAETRPHFSASSVCTAFVILASRSALRSSSVAPASRVFSLSSISLRLALISEPLSPCYILHDQAPLYGHSSAYPR